MRERKEGRLGEESRMIIGCGGKRQEEEAQHFQVELVAVGRLRLCGNAIT